MPSSVGSSVRLARAKLVEERRELAVLGADRAVGTPRSVPVGDSDSWRH